MYSFSWKIVNCYSLCNLNIYIIYRVGGGGGLGELTHYLMAYPFQLIVIPDVNFHCILLRGHSSVT